MKVIFAKHGFRVALLGALALSQGVSQAFELPQLADEKPWAASEHPGVVLPSHELTAKLVYQLLLAEIAAQREHFGVAVDTYLELAQSTGDPRVARRASEVAFYAHDLKAAQTAVNIWLESDPMSIEARETLAVLMLSQSKLPDMTEVLTKLLANDKDPVTLARDFRNLNIVFLQHPDHEAVFHLAEQLAEPYPNLPEAHYLVGSAAFLAQQVDVALAQARAASALRPGWEASTLLEARVLQDQDAAQARAFYREYLVRYPGARDVRMVFARYLVDLKDYQAAREQFNIILQEAPDNPDLTLAVALLTLQLKDYAEATPLFQKALALGYRDPNTVRFYLGEAYEEQKQWDEATRWYNAVNAGEQLTAARIHVALMLAHQNQLQKAMALLREVPVHTAEQHEQVILAEEQMLRESGDYQGAYDTLTRELHRTPDSPDLLYERAIVSDKLNRMDTLEQDLRKVMVLRPEYAHAYNALGYSLADRSIRLDEALVLIKKALALAPDDPFILDSLGWVQFRLGHLQESIATLKQAYALQEDPEIAAHLGEVLWVSGNQPAARKTWEDGLKTHPDNDALLATVHRFLH